jgi:hypothetical protein
VSNHVVDLVNKYPRDQLPPALTGYVSDRTGYDYHHHAEVGSANAAFVEDDVVDLCFDEVPAGRETRLTRADNRDFNLLIHAAES